MAILVICTVAHFYSVAHLTAVTALKQIDPEFETVVGLAARAVLHDLREGHAAGLPAGAARHRHLPLRQRDDDGLGRRVPLFAPTTLAAVAVLNMDDAGDVAPAAAMAMMIFATAAALRTAYYLSTQLLLRKVQAWRRR